MRRRARPGFSRRRKTKLDGLPTYARTILVTGGGTSIANGEALVNALAGISGNSSSSPYLVKIEPGVYYLTSQLVMKSYVDIEGSGQNATFITIPRGTSSLVLAFNTTFTSSSQLSVSKANTSTLMVATLQVDSASTGVPKCVHVYDTDGDDLNNVCPSPII